MSFLKDLLRHLKYGAYQWRYAIYALGAAFILLAGFALYYSVWLTAAKSAFYGAAHMCLYYKSLEWSAKP